MMAIAVEFGGCRCNYVGGYLGSNAGVESRGVGSIRGAKGIWFRWGGWGFDVLLLRGQGSMVGSLWVIGRRMQRGES